MNVQIASEGEAPGGGGAADQVHRGGAGPLLGQQSGPGKGQICFQDFIKLRLPVFYLEFILKIDM